MKQHRVYLTVPRTPLINPAERFRLLFSRLSPEELVCISHCTVFDDCAADGACELQEKVDKIVGE